MATDPELSAAPPRDDPVTTLRVRGAVGPTVAVILGSFVALLTLLILGRETAPNLAAILAVSALPVLLALLAWPRTLRVGNDGLSFGRPWRRFFVPARDIRSVHQRRTGPKEASEARSVPEIVLLRRGGRSAVVIPMVGPSPERVAVAVDRIRRIAADAATSRASTLSVLDRGGRTLEVWRRDLAEVLRPGGFRTAGLDEHDLREILEDPAARSEQRIGAAIALASAPTDAGDRIRVAASASARPRLRIALERVAEGEAAAEIEAALAEEAETSRDAAAAREDAAAG